MFGRARAAGVTTVLNPAPAAPIDDAVIASTDWLVPNEHEFALIGGGTLGGETAAEDAALRDLADRLGVSLVVTLGERGAAVLPRGGTASRGSRRRRSARPTRPGRGTRSSGRSPSASPSAGTRPTRRGSGARSRRTA